jgi:hypothetical protein
VALALALAVAAAAGGEKKKKKKGALSWSICQFVLVACALRGLVSH